MFFKDVNGGIKQPTFRHYCFLHPYSLKDATQFLQFYSFHIVVWQRTATKCTNNYNARVQLLFCSFNLLFGEVRGR